MAGWLHSHGPSGEHLHLLAGQVDPDPLGTLHDWHDAQHGHEHEDATDEEDEPTPVGLLIDFPQILAAPCVDPSFTAASSLHSLAFLPPPRWHLAPVAGPHGDGFYPSGWPPQGAKRSGVAALLRSSHAILI